MRSRKKHLRISLGFCLLCSINLLITAGCGKRRPPQPPAKNQSSALSSSLLSGSQRGNRIILRWHAPSRRTSENALQNPQHTEVYRVEEEIAAPLSLTESQFAARSSLIGVLDTASLTPNGQPPPPLIFTDTITFGSRGVRLRYAVRYVNPANQRTAFSNFVIIEPAPRVAAPPVLLAAEATESGVRLRWQPPAANIDGSTPINLLGFNIYRRSAPTADDANPKPLNAEVIDNQTYTDTSARFAGGGDYTYFVRAVSLGTEGRLIESLDSNSLSISPRDTFPPSPPSAISIAATPNRLTLFFPANSEPDVAGYLVFRSTDDKLALDKWRQMTSEIIARNTFPDSDVKSGVRYFYYLVAVDTSGNRSQPSEIVSELVPQ